MAGMSALVLRVVFSCSFPFFPSFLLFCICLFLSRFFHSRYFRSKQRTQSCSHSLTGSVYIWGQASKPCWSQALHPSLALFRPSASSQSFVPWVFPMLLRATVPPSLTAGTSGWALPGCSQCLQCRAPVGLWATHSSLLWRISSVPTTRFLEKGTVYYFVCVVAQHSSPEVQGTTCFL